MENGGLMSYLVLARKWRPKRFAELVGQEHVVRALSNALDSGRVHHAFLFTGTRGVGKTTIARIFAKSLNCEQGTSADPCGQCAACSDIDAGRYIDLLEIDAASNTGVDDVREVIENAQYMPSRGKYKVYLIDEVHMLSKAAFNALLKTLEEPPEHVKFLLATTDPQKLPVTVLSRCLQFNLKRPDEDQIQGQMTRIRRQKRSRQTAVPSYSWPRPLTAACATACRCWTGRSPMPAARCARTWCAPCWARSIAPRWRRCSMRWPRAMARACCRWWPRWPNSHRTGVACWKRWPKACTASACSSWYRVRPLPKARTPSHSPSACARKWCSSGTRWP